MKNTTPFIFLIAILLLASMIAFFSPIQAISLASLFVSLGVLLILFQLWKDVIDLDFIFKFRAKKDPIVHDNLSRAAFVVRNASEGSNYGRRELAAVIREALLNKYFSNSFPIVWIATKVGDGAIMEILKTNHASDLMEAFSLPELDSQKQSGDKKEYLSKLERALAFASGRNIS